MYEQFGALVDHAIRSVTFKLFVPDNTKAPFQYEGPVKPHIKAVSVVGNFQEPSHNKWDLDHPIPLTESDYKEKKGLVLGQLYTATVSDIPEGFYEYKYKVEFEDGQTRFIADPCCRYGGESSQNSGFVVGGTLAEVEPLAIKRRPLEDLVIYELMIDDFTHNIKKADESPLQTVTRKLDELQELGVNAIEFMPWTTWYSEESDGFNWGYNPVHYLSVAHKYTQNSSAKTDKLVYLKQLISQCHSRGIQVIMDGVFGHADTSAPDKGFPYYWLYQNPKESPFIGDFAEPDGFQDLNYNNRCTLEYVRDACIYWIDTLKIDGIRFDHTTSMYRQGDSEHGIAKLIAELRQHLAKKKSRNFAFIIEHSWDYEAIDVVNEVDATSCWLDPFRAQSMSFLENRPDGVPQIEPSILRVLDSARDFGEGRVPVIYIENHDHKRIVTAAGGRDHWQLTRPFAIALFTCAGAPLIYNGQEWALDNDMPETGHGRVVPRPLDWSLRSQKTGRDAFDFYQKLIAVRGAHPALRSRNFYPSDWDEDDSVPNKEGFGIDGQRGLVIYHRWADARKKTDRYYIVLNFSSQPQCASFEVPEDGPWERLLGSGKEKAANGHLEIEIEPNSGEIFYRRS